MKKIFQKKYLSIASVAVVGIMVGLIIQFANAWTAPSSTAPNGNVDAPITTGVESQVKKGLISAQGFANIGSSLGHSGTRCLCDSNSSASDCYNKSDTSDFTSDPNPSIGSVCYDYVGVSVSAKLAYEFNELTISGRGLEFADGTIQKTAVENINVDAGLCYDIADTSNVCANGYYMRSSAKCCPFSSSTPSVSSIWYEIPSLKLWKSGDLDDHWSTEVVKTALLPRDIVSIRVSGDADEDGYCYAYWGGSNPGHVYSIGTNGVDGWNGVVGGNTAQDDPVYNVDNKTYADGACPTFPATFDNYGNVKLCGNPNTDRLVAIAQNNTNISEGTLITFKGNFLDEGGDNGGHIDCKLEVKYAY